MKKEYKFKIAGSVIDKSSTGNTLFIEPTASAKYYEELQLLKILGDSVMIYPEDYDFSIIFDTVENRKLRHDMERKYVEGEIVVEES